MKHRNNFSSLFVLPAFCVVATIGWCNQTFAASNSLEEEMFGSENKAPTAAPASAPASAPTTAVPTKSSTSTDQLTLGGRLEVNTTLLKNSGQTLGDSTLVSTTGAELYLDARPSDNVRGFIKGALSQQAAAQSGLNFAIYETWVKWNSSSGLFTTLGQQKLKWGAATFWNPTDFLAVQPKDPLANFDVRPGAKLLKLHLPFEKSGNNLYALMSFENTTAAHDPKLAARAEINYGLGNFTGEITATAAGGRRQPQQFGVDINTSAGPFDVIAEAAWTRKSPRQFYKSVVADDGSRKVESYSRENQSIAQVVTGLRYDLKYSESDSANLSVEYFWNDFGSSDVVSEAMSFVRGQAQRLYLANRYLGANLVLVQPGTLNDSTLLLSGLWNMTDKSWLARAGWTEKLDMRSNLIVSLTRTGGLGEFTGGIPTSVANQLRNSQLSPELKSGLDRIEGRAQEWVVSVSANLDL